MLSESDREEFKKPAASYMNALSTLEHKEDEIYRFAKTCGAYADWRVLAKIILPLPDPSRARSQFIRKYYELREELPLGLGEWPPLERKTQIRINTLASAYERLLNEKRRLHHEILGLAEERGVFEDEDSLEEILSFVDTACYLRLLLAERLRILHEIQADQDNAVSHQKGEEPCSEEPAPSPYPQQSM